VNFARLANPTQLVKPPAVPSFRSLAPPLPP
jgi:hypothetical protein